MENKNEIVGLDEYCAMLKKQSYEKLICKLRGVKFFLDMSIKSNEKYIEVFNEEYCNVSDDSDIGVDVNAVKKLLLRYKDRLDDINDILMNTEYEDLYNDN